MTKINKIRKIERAVIVLVMLFAFLSPIVTKHVKFPEGSEMPEVPWYNPELADFLYDNTVDQTTYNFNAYNESYILCNIQNTAYANFTFNSSMYNVSYGINVIPIDFGVINQSYSIDIAQYDIDNDIFDWICVQPLIIKEESIEVNLATTTDRTFDAGGAITLLVQANFSYNWLEIEVDDIKINEIHDTSTYVEVDSVFLSVIRYGGIYIPYDMFLSPGQHIVKFRGNGSINYKIMCSYDWDDDYISDVEEIQRQDVETFLDPVEANIWGFFELGDSRVHAYDLDFQFGSYLVYIPESCGDDNFLRINVHMGSIGDVRVDNDKLMLMDSSISSFYGQISSGYYGKISAGFHSIQYNYTQQGITEVSFSINGVAISTLDKPEALDSDADGVKNVNEQKYGLNIYGIDTDCDRLVDSVDTSPVSAVYLDNDNITRIVIPHEENMTTQVTMSIGIPEDDYTTYEGTEIWRAGDEGGLEVSITPVLRLFGNSSISVSELKDIWDKKMVTYNLTESVCPDNGDGLPEGFEQNGEVALILPAFSKYSFDFNFYYGVNNTAKDNSNIDMRFDVVWLVLSHEANVTEVIHFYDFNEDIILQAFSVR